ncbi:uncharacterized protein LOC119105436 [Pollicipes pollicipes]|uniref:uncharacterized protein LOC119105436 n=1 Tax=Pollicipes pollicipes TaxID=41117 RepID=UPI001884A9F4|nr:uncharacterized protein LOC119105436 [Pollicipes pollicipes]
MAELAGRLPDAEREERLSVASDGSARRVSEGGESGRARWLTSSGRLYRSPRPVRRGGSAEDVAAHQSRKVELKRSEMALKARSFDPLKVALKGTLRRRGSSKEEDSSPDTPAAEMDAPELSAEGCDLVASLVQTLDQKLLELAGRPDATEKRSSWSSAGMYRDPSLHRSFSASSQLQMMNGCAGGERPVGAPARPPPRRPPTADAKKGMKRSIRERFEQRAAEPTRARAAHGSPRALKRRHTVGGSKDIDRFVRLFLAASRTEASGDGDGAAVRPTSCLAGLELLPLQPLPLESRV